MHIRPATTADRSAILSLMRPHDPNRMGLDPTRFLVAEANGHVIGIVQIKRHWDGTPELASLVVAEERRGQGIGSALVRSIVQQHITTDPSETLYLFCLAQLAGYYGRLGFRLVPRKHLPWSLAMIHLLGNGLGQLLGWVADERFQVITMCHQNNFTLD